MLSELNAKVDRLQKLRDFVTTTVVDDDGKDFKILKDEAAVKTYKRVKNAFASADWELERTIEKIKSHEEVYKPAWRKYLHELSKDTKLVDEILNAFDDRPYFEGEGEDDCVSIHSSGAIKREIFYLSMNGKVHEIDGEAPYGTRDWSFSDEPKEGIAKTLWDLLAKDIRCAFSEKKFF